MSEHDEGVEGQPHLERRFGLLQAVALNMANMVGVGPFVTMSLLVTKLGGPQALLGWVAALVILIPDGMIWAELSAAMPGSGGSYVYLREGFGRDKWGRLLAFLFIWQFIISGPLEIASGCIGFAQYATYIWHGLTERQMQLLGAVVALVCVILLYRRITSIAKLTVALWIGMLLTIAAVVFAGLPHFDAQRAFDFPPGAFHVNKLWLGMLAGAARIGVYDFLGYYDVCYIGEEVRNPGRVIPRAILISLLGVAVLYFAMNLSVLGVIPWREFVPAKDHPEMRDALFSVFMERLYGRGVASVFTVMVLWTAVASVFALILGYSRIPYAAAKDGAFFPAFTKLHPAGFPALSLLVIGAVSIVCSFFSLDAVITALLTTRILVQFVGQIGAVMLLRRTRPDMERPYRIWLYPVPCLVALIGWIWLFWTAEAQPVRIGLITVAAGIPVFLIWSQLTQQWPFASSRKEARVDE